MSPPLNLPPRFASWTGGRLLVSAVPPSGLPPQDAPDAVRPSTGYWDAPRGDLAAEVAAYRETFHDIVGLGSEAPRYGLERLVLPYLPFSVEAVVKDAREVNPQIETLTISSTSGEGLDEWCDWLLARVEEKKAESLAVA